MKIICFSSSLSFFFFCIASITQKGKYIKKHLSNPLDMWRADCLCKIRKHYIILKTFFCEPRNIHTALQYGSFFHPITHTKGNLNHKWARSPVFFLQFYFRKAAILRMATKFSRYSWRLIRLSWSFTTIRGKKIPSAL